jgi:hypothetical protein
MCRHLLEKFYPYGQEIPVTDYHKQQLAVREREAEIAEEERQRMEAQYQAGHDEYYDR